MASISGANVKRITVACEAGMGSSVMVAKQLAKKLKDQGVTVTHTPVNQLVAGDQDVVLCHRGLGGRAKQALPDSVIVMFDMFLGDLKVAKMIHDIETDGEITGD